MMAPVLQDILRELVEFRTVSDDHETTNRALAYIGDFLQDHGMQVREFESNGFGSLVATTRHTNTPAVMLAAHLDVVDAPDSMFKMVARGDKFYGRGVYDMKFAIAIYMQLVRELQAELKNYDFGIMITTDEEISGINGTKYLVEKGFVPTKVCVLPDGGYNWQIETLAKGLWQGHIEMPGKATHGSRPWEGDSASFKLIDLLAEIKQRFTVQAPDTETLNIGKINAGAAVNQIPSLATADLDVRFISKQNFVETKRFVENLCKKYGASCTTMQESNPCVNSLDNPYIGLFRDIIEQTVGIECTGSISYGATDARYFAAANVPCVVVQPIAGGHHADDEWLDKEAFFQYKTMLKIYLQELARVHENPRPRTAAKKPGLTEAAAL